MNTDPKTTHTPLPDQMEGQERVVYIRALRPEETEGAEIPPGVEKLYALHADNGQRLALFGDRDAAFHLARFNELTPVSVH